MVDISEKAVTKRQARAAGIIKMTPKAYDEVKKGNVKKGDVFSTARIAGIMAAKNTSSMIPLCHPLLPENIEVELSYDDNKCGIRCECTVTLSGKTGAEMEALTGVSVALLTVYDMCKALDKGMVIEKIRLLSNYHRFCKISLRILSSLASERPKSISL